MDSKIILAVLIVALIGIVAATYHNQTSDVMNSLANVATEDSDAVKSVTDLAEASSAGSGSMKVDESIVQPDSSVNSKVVSTPKSSNSQKTSPPSTSSSSSDSANSPSTDTNNQGISSNTATDSSNTPSGSSNTSTQQPYNSNNPTNNNQNSSSQQSGISETEAMSIAKNNLPTGVTSDYQKVSETTINGEKYYDVNLYKDGEIIASAEINSKGNITGGAMVGEAPSR